MVVVLAIFGLVLFGSLLFFVVPRMAGRTVAARPTVSGVIIGKRAVAPMPGAEGPTARLRYQLLVDVEGGAHWTWCDAETFERAQVGDAHVTVDPTPHVNERWRAWRG